MHTPEYGFARKSFDLKHFGSKKIAATSFVMVATMFTSNSMSAGEGSWALILMIVILDNIKEGNFEISLSIVEKF